MSKVDNKKEQKRNSLLDSAFTLYFKDKYDIRNHLISHKANQVFQAACTELAKQEEIKDFEEQVLFIIDHILDQFAENHNLVLLISKHLSWGFFKDFLSAAPGKDIPSIYETYEAMLAHAAHTYRTPDIMMYMILELVSGTSYNTILYEQPVPLNQIKKPLYEIIKGIFIQYRKN